MCLYTSQKIASMYQNAMYKLKVNFNIIIIAASSRVLCLAMMAKRMGYIVLFLILS